MKLARLLSRRTVLGGALALVASVLVGCGPKEAAPTAEGVSEPVTLTVYSGRKEAYVQPLFDKFQEQTGHTLEVRYGGSPDLARLLSEEHGQDAVRADVFVSQDAGSLGMLSGTGIFETLPGEITDRVAPAFRAADGSWVGVTGRARVVAYSTERVKPEDLPDSITGFTAPEWKGRIGWPPKNGSFQAFVTALRVSAGDDAAREWVKGIQANEAVEYPKNTPVIQAIADGAVDVGFVNHYYLFRFIAEHGEEFPVRNHHFATGDIGNMINVSGAAVTTASEHAEVARELVAFLLSAESQQYFADSIYEYPLVEGVKTHPVLLPLAEIQHPELDFASLADQQATQELLREAGALK